jgi:acetyltransferase-like isoleucine patch superfamily enzyme
MNAVTLRARVTRPYWSRRFGHLGTGAIVHKPRWVLGGPLISIGDHALILHDAWLAVETLAWQLPGPVLEIGNRVGMRPGVTISAVASIVIEDDVIMGAYCSIVDSDHTFAWGHPNVMHNPLDSAPIRIGRGTWLADGVTVLRGANIGRCCMIGAKSVVRDDLPDYSIAVGSPARVVGEVTGVDAEAPPATDSLW